MLIAEKDPIILAQDLIILMWDLIILMWDRDPIILEIQKTVCSITAMVNF